MNETNTMRGNQFSSSHPGRRAWQRYGRSAVRRWTLLGLSVLLLVSCVSLTTTPQRTPTVPGKQTSATPQLTQRYDFTAQESGKTVTYVVTTRFEIFLNQQQYPKQHVQVSCTPPGALGSVSNLPSVAPPLYVVRYETVQPGTCTIKNGAFLLTVRIIPLPD